MTLFVHELIDILERRRMAPRFTMIEGAWDSAKLFASNLRKAEKFDFGHLLLEPTSILAPDGSPVWRTPQLTDAETEMLRMGMIPLPSPVSWYEFVIGNDGWRIGLLVYEGTGGDWYTGRVDYLNGTGVWDSTWVRRHSDGRVTLHGAIDRMRTLRSNKKEVDMLIYKSSSMLAEYLTLMLNSKTTEITASRPQLQTRPQRRRGETPMPEHRIVNIVPERFRTVTDGSGTHASPRLHWRRSHVRHFKEKPMFGAKWFPDLEHDGSKGWWAAVIARHLVGRADLGEVTHEYKVKQ